VGGALLMAGEDELDGRVDQGVENRDGSSAGMAEYVFDPVLMDAVDEGFGSGAHFVGHVLPLWKIRIGFRSRSITSFGKSAIAGTMNIGIILILPIKKQKTALF
jgi:hypothetical protein